MQEDVKYITINIILKVQIWDNTFLNSFHICYPSGKLVILQVLTSPFCHKEIEARTM